MSKDIILKNVNRDLNTNILVRSNLYHGKVFLVCCMNRVEKAFKTKRGAAGYIKRQSYVSWYDDYTQKLVCAGDGLEIVEVKETELIDYKNNKMLWYLHIRANFNNEYTYSQIEADANKYIEDEEIKAYVLGTLNTLRNQGEHKSLVVYECGELLSDKQEELNNSLKYFIDSNDKEMIKFVKKELEEVNNKLEKYIVADEKQEINEINNKISSVQVVYNEEKNGIELSFTDKPSEEVRAELKANGFRWHRVNKVWYAKDTEERREFIKGFNNQEESIKIEEIKDEENINNTYNDMDKIEPGFIFDCHFKEWNLTIEDIENKLKSFQINNYYISGNKFIFKNLTYSEIVAIDEINKELNKAILFIDKKDEVKENDIIKPFTKEELEETNKIINTIIEMDWELLSVEIEQEDNCIWGIVKKSNGKTEKEGLYAPSYDLHELDGVYRCLKGKIVNETLIDGMVFDKKLSTLTEDLKENNIVDFEGVKENKKEMENNFNIDDILNMYDNVEVKNENRLSNEDMEAMQQLEKKFNDMREKFKLYLDFYDDNKIIDFDNKELTRSIYNLHDDFVKEVVFPKCQAFISNVYYYFKNKYNVTLDTLEFDRDYNVTSRKERANVNLNWVMEKLNLDLLIDDIFNQLGGFNFKSKEIEEAKEKVINKCTGWNKSLLSVKGKNLSIQSYIYYGSWRGYEVDYNNIGSLKPLLTLVEEFNNTTNTNEFLIENLKTYNDVTGQEFKIEGDKITGIKFYKNGKVQLIFNNGSNALNFAKEYLNYNEVA